MRNPPVVQCLSVPGVGVDLKTGRLVVRRRLPASVFARSAIGSLREAPVLEVMAYFVFVLVVASALWIVASAFGE